MTTHDLHYVIRIACCALAPCLGLGWAGAVSGLGDEYAPSANGGHIKTQDVEAVAVSGLVRTTPEHARFVETEHGYMIPYEETIPGTDVNFKMIPVPGGMFSLGSPEEEEGRSEDEGPPVQIEVPPFWIAKTEVTWAEYKTFMAMYDDLKMLSELRSYANYAFTKENQKQKQAELAGVLKKLPSLHSHVTHEPAEADAITTPTPLYDVSFTFETGEEPDQPAVTMTQYAAKQYTKWLSGLTGRDFRLPTEAEWEYAARAGSDTAYGFGDDMDELDEYAWFFENSDDSLQSVASKEPNQWGIHDMHGSVAEWVLDQYIPDHYAKLAKMKQPISVEAAFAQPNKEFPRVLKGGSWADDPERCRSAVRMQSNWEWSEGEMGWKDIDPNLPKSPWWFSEPPGRQVGFRIVRPLTPMNDKQKQLFWNADIDSIRNDVRDRLSEGRGVTGVSDPKLPQALSQLKDEIVRKALQALKSAN